MSGRVFFYGGAVLSKTTRVLFAAVACAFVVTQATAQDAAAPSVSLGGGLRAGASWGGAVSYTHLTLPTTPYV